MGERRYEIRRLADLIPAEDNPRKDLQPGDRGWQNIHGSLEEFEMVEPYVLNERTGRLVGGTQRRKIEMYRGVKEGTVLIIDCTPEQEVILRVKLNRIHGYWDNEKLYDLLDEIKQETGTLDGTGFEQWEMDNLVPEYDHINDLMQDDFSDMGKNESNTFDITFTFPLEKKAVMDAYIDDNGKEALRDLVLLQAKGE